jgi:hypothetical protein
LQRKPPQFTVVPALEPSLKALPVTWVNEVFVRVFTGAVASPILRRPDESPAFLIFNTRTSKKMPNADKVVRWIPQDLTGNFDAERADRAGFMLNSLRSFSLHVVPGPPQPIDFPLLLS